MDRREFIVSAAAVSVGACAEGLAAAGAPFDPTEQSLAALQRALTAGPVTSEALTQAYLERIARFDQPSVRASLGAGAQSRCPQTPRAQAMRNAGRERFVARCMGCH